jgi:hypothetical protein
VNFEIKGVKYTTYLASFDKEYCERLVSEIPYAENIEINDYKKVKLVHSCFFNVI